MELNLTPMGKLFFGSLVAWIANGSAMPFKVRGTPEQLQALANAVFASKRYMEYLKDPQATIDGVLDKLNEKNQMAREFSEKTGFTFPL